MQISAATNAALKMPALNQPNSLGNADVTPFVAGVRRLTLETSDGQRWAVLAAAPCATGEQHCDQAATNGHDAECDFLHDVLFQRVAHTTAVIGD